MANVIQNRTFGVEIEVISRHHSRRGLAQLIENAGLPCQYEDYHHQTREHWRVTTDRSLDEDDRIGDGAEIVSPILRGEEGLRQVAKVCQVLTEARCEVTSRTGVHVHIGVGDCTVAQIKRVCMNFLNIEPMFDLILPESRRGNNNRFIQSNRGRFSDGYSRSPFTKQSVEEGFRRLRAYGNSMSELVSVWQGPNEHSDRYYKLNLHCFRRQGTIEFRHHSGTTDPVKLCNWIRLLMSFTCYSISGSPRPCAERPEKLFNMFFGLFTDLKPLRPYYVARWNELSGLRKKSVKKVVGEAPPTYVEPGVHTIEAAYTPARVRYDDVCDPFRDAFADRLRERVRRRSSGIQFTVRERD